MKKLSLVFLPALLAFGLCAGCGQAEKTAGVPDTTAASVFAQERTEEDVHTDAAPKVREEQGELFYSSVSSITS